MLFLNICERWWSKNVEKPLVLSVKSVVNMCKSANWRHNRIKLKVTSKTKNIKNSCKYAQKCELETKSDKI